MKKILVQFDFPPGVTSAQYDRIWEDLRASGHEHPDGLLFHAGAPKADGGWLVIDMWETEEHFKKFGQTLMPLIQKQELPMVQPKILPVHQALMFKEEAVGA